MFKIFGTPKPGDIKTVSANPDDAMPRAAEVVSQPAVNAMAEDKKKDEDAKTE